MYIISQKISSNLEHIQNFLKKTLETLFFWNSDIDGNLPWYYAESAADDKMKDILRVGLEAFINQEEENNQKKNHFRQSQKKLAYGSYFLDFF